MYPRSMISDNIWAQLCALAKVQNIEAMRDGMFNGDSINSTEGRAVGHVWLRSGDNNDVLKVLNQMQNFVNKTHRHSNNSPMSFTLVLGGLI